MNVSGSFNLWLTFLHHWLLDQVTWMIRSLELLSRWRATPSTPPNGWNGPEEMEASGSAPSCSPSQSLVRRQMPDHPKTWYCLEIQVISTEDGRTTPSPLHAWQAPVVGDMLWDGKSGPTEAVVMGPDWAILFYGRQSLGEGLSWGEACDIMFTLWGAISWIGKQAQLNARALSPWEGCWFIAKAKPSPNGTLKLGDLDIPIPIYLHFCHSGFAIRMGPYRKRGSRNTEEHVEEPRHTHQMSHHDWGWVPPCGWDHSQMWWHPWAALAPSPSLDLGFKSDKSSVSTSSSVSSRADRSWGSRCMHHGQCCRETGGHMKINLPVFKDEDKKDTITYQSWPWDLMVYHHAGCWDCTLLPYIIHSIQGYHGELVRSLGTDVTLDSVLAILNEHYNNVKALDALNQELFQLQMGEKETVSEWGSASVKAPPNSHGLIPRMLPTGSSNWIEVWPLLQRAA